MTENKYKSYRFIKQYGKAEWVGVDETGKIVNMNPSKDELKILEREPYIANYHQSKKYTDEDLLNELRRFEKEHRRSPTEADFGNNPGYPSYVTFQRRFGSWDNALKMAGLDINSYRHHEVKLNIPEREPQKNYTDEELLNELIRFEKEYGRSPTEADFRNNPEYPSYVTFQRMFGSWIGALKLAGLDIDLMGHQGNSYRGRQAEIMVLNHFKQHPIDLAGKNPNSTCDGICPNGKTYDVKSSRFDLYKKRYHFRTTNKDKDDYKDAIQWYYLLALNGDDTIKYVWRIPGEMVEKDDFLVGMNPNYEFNIENMKEFDITDKFKDNFN